MNWFKIMNIKELIDVVFTSASKGDNRAWPSYQFLSSPPISISPVQSQCKAKTGSEA